MRNLQISTIDNHEDWARIAPQWNQLLQESRSSTFFLTWEWLSSWAECCLDKNRRLFILVFHENDRLIGAAPFYIEDRKAGPFPLREIRFLGTPDAGSDYLDVFTRKGREKIVADALYDYLTTDEGKSAWDQLDLADIRADSLFLLHFPARIKAAGKHATADLHAYCPLMRLPSSEAGLYAQCSPGWRKKIKQDIRVIHRERNVRHSVSRNGNLPEKLAEFFHLYEAKTNWPVGRLPAILERTAAKHGDEVPVQVDLLSIDGRAVVGLVHLKHQNTLSMYLMAVDKEYNPKVSLGNYLVGESIINAIASGYTAYDFLKGEEPYKFHWAKEGIRTMRLLFWQRRPGPVYSAFARLLKNAGKLLLR